MASGKSERDRMQDAKDKTGVFTGAFAINPINDEKIPIYIADYVLMGYGTGAIMAVPAHDDRDFAFAKKFNIPIQLVVAPRDGHAPDLKKAFTDEASRSIRRSSTACRPQRRRNALSRRWSARTLAGGRSTTSCATGSSRASGIGASRSRSCWTTRAAPLRWTNPNCRSNCRRSRTSSRPARPSRR
jgi:leucyl-tRNA synthetase